MFTLSAEQYSIYSDVHKDAYGFRPRQMPTYQDRQSFDDDMDYMCSIIREEERAARIAKRKSLRELFARLRGMMEQHNIDLPTALRWDIDAEDAKMGDSIDVGYYCWLTHISYMHERRLGRILKIPYYLNAN